MSNPRIINWANWKYALQDQYLRITQNPVAPDYPHTGDILTLHNHHLLPDGRYLVTMATEFEPPNTTDEHGRDIRLSLLSELHQHYKDYNGVNIRAAIVSVKQAKLG